MPVLFSPPNRLESVPPLPEDIDVVGTTCLRECPSRIGGRTIFPPLVYLFLSVFFFPILGLFFPRFLAVAVCSLAALLPFYPPPPLWFYSFSRGVVFFLRFVFTSSLTSNSSLAFPYRSLLFIYRVLPPSD